MRGMLVEVAKLKSDKIGPQKNFIWQLLAKQVAIC